MNSTIAIFLLIFFSIIFGYFIGSILASDVIKIFLKKNAREYWSMNPGTTNSFRVFGKKYGTIVGIFDVLKGFCTFIIVWIIFEYWLKNFLDEKLYNNVYYLVYLTNLFIIIGHCWPIYYKFKGGKAAAPTVGFLISISFWWFIIITIIWILVLLKWKYVSLATLSASILLPIINLINYIDYLNFFNIGKSPITNYLTYQNDWHVILFLEIMCILICGIIFLRHRSNIIRLINKTENKIKTYKK